MRYAIFFDTHIKSNDNKKVHLLQEILESERKLGTKIVWGGDIIDLVEDDSINPKDLNLFREDDIYILGNHDPFPIPNLKNDFYFKTENTFVMHGDQLDVHYVLTLFELTLKRKIVVRESAYEIYRALVQLPDYLINSVKNSFLKLLRKEALEIPKIKNLIAFWPVLAKACGNLPEMFHHPKEIEIFPVYTLDAKQILRKIFYMEPEAKRFKNIIIGHLHPDNLIEYQENEYNLFVSPSMLNSRWGYFVIDNEKITFERVF